MADDSKLTGPTGKIEFSENHRPALPSGDYEITVKQSITTKEIVPTGSGKAPTKLVVDHVFQSKKRTFSVLGPRFTLEPQLIREVFPPAGSLGEHSSLLPHISFNRSTLPWERFTALSGEDQKQAQDALIKATVDSANLGNDANNKRNPEKSSLDTPALKTPWLALLLFDQGELVEKEADAEKKRLVEPALSKGKVSGPKACKLRLNEDGKLWRIVASDPAADDPAGLLSPIFAHEAGQQADDPVTVIDVAGDLLKAILPSLTDVQLLGHVREPTDAADISVGDPVATLIANRLPKKGHMSIVHLVSLEGKYESGSEQLDIWNLTRKFPKKAPFVRLVSLKSWRFSCVDEKHSFKGLLHHLNKEHLFFLDKDLVKLLPATSDKTELSEGVRSAFIRNMSLVPPALAKKVDITRKQSDEGISDIWQITDGNGKQYAIQHEKSAFRVFRNEKYLFEFDLTAKQGKQLADAQEIPKWVQDAFDNHMAVSAEKTRARLDRDVWIIEDKDKHLRYRVRREQMKHSDAERLGVYQNQKFLFALNYRYQSKLTSQENEQAIEKEIRGKLAALDQAVQLSSEANIRKETVETWRITDPKGSDYMIRKNGKQYEVHRNLPHTLKLPTDHLIHARQFIEQGCVAMPHEMRQGNRSVSWYHGPLAPGRVGYELDLKSLAKVEEIPTQAVNTVIIAKVSEQLNFRVFDHEGLQVVGKGEKELPDCAVEIEALKKELKDLWGEEEQEVSQKDKIVRSVTSMLGLSGQESAAGGSLRVRSADQLIRYNPANGMFDVSYATAWELGRLLTLQNAKVAVSLLDWKRRHRRDQERQRAMQALEHLPIVGQPVVTDLPADVSLWFRELSLLNYIPFNYLVPDERMLPQESIRFFRLDPEWVRCLHDGAFSIGRVLPSDHQRDAAHDQHLLAKPHAMVTGFLLRSEVVSGWPALQVDAYEEAITHENYEHDTQPPPDKIKAMIPFDAALQEAMNKGDASMLVSRFGFDNVNDITVSADVINSSRWLVNINQNQKLYRVENTGSGFQLSIENSLPMLRMERLSPNLLMCMFAGDMKALDIHQKPEALHFGCNRDGDTGDYYRELKSQTGGELPGCKVAIPWGKDEGSDNDEREAAKRVISIKRLNNAILGKPCLSLSTTLASEQDDTGKTGTSAQFALQMTEGVQKVRFVVQSFWVPATE